MTNIDKFYSDADKIVKRNWIPGTADRAKLVQEFGRLFLSWTRDFGETAQEIEAYWEEQYAEKLTSPESIKEASEWLAGAYALLTDNFTDEMNFTDKDWSAIKDILSFSANSMDLETLTSIMKTIVERGKFD